MLIFLGILLLGVVAWNAFACMHVIAMTRFVDSSSRTAAPESLSRIEKLKTLVCGVRLPRPENDMTPEDYGMHYTSLTIQSEPDVALGVWQIVSPSPKGLVILLHGYSERKCSLLEHSKVLFEMGYDCLLVDFRGSGDSSGNRTTVGYKEGRDVCAVYAYARANFPDQKIFLFGQSMGAAAILRAIHTDAIRPDGIILEAVFDTLLQTTKNRFTSMGVPSFPSAHLLTFWGGIVMRIDTFSHSPMDYAKAVTTPALVLHGGKDPRARLEDGRRVYEALEGPKSMYVFEALAHEAYVAAEPTEWRDHMQRFLSNPQALRPPHTGAHGGQ